MRNKRPLCQGIVGSLSLAICYIFGLMTFSLSLPSVEAELPEPRWGHGAVLINNTLYIYGGKVGITSTNNASQDSSQLLQLDMTQYFSISEPNWVNGSQGPQVAYHTVSLGGSENELLVIYGGESGEMSPPTNSLYYYNTHTQKWVIPDLVLPRRSMHTAVTRNDSLIFILGGTNTTNLKTQIQLNNFFSLNTKNVSWSWMTIDPQDNTPSTRYLHTSTMLADGKMYVIGGISGDSLVDISQIYIYDTYEGSWSVQTASGISPTNRGAHTAVGIHDGKIIIHGGANPTFTNIYQDIGVLDTTENPCAWVNVSVTGKIPLSRYSHTATMVGSNMIIAFGYLENNVADANIYVLDTTNYSWVDSYRPNNLMYTDTKPTPPTMMPTSQATTTHSHPPTKNSMSAITIIIIVGSIMGSIVTLILLVTVIKFCLIPCWSKNRKDVYSVKSFLVPQYPQPKDRDMKKSSVSSMNNDWIIPSLTYLDGVHEKTYSQVLDDRMMGIDIQISNMAIVPKPKLRVMNPDEPDIGDSG